MRYRDYSSPGGVVNMPDISSHKARHTWAVIALDSGIPLEVVREVTIFLTSRKWYTADDAQERNLRLLGSSFYKPG
jgi:hypothetical protein